MEKSSEDMKSGKNKQGKKKKKNASDQMQEMQDQMESSIPLRHGWCKWEVN